MKPITLIHLVTEDTHGVLGSFTSIDLAKKSLNKSYHMGEVIYTEVGDKDCPDSLIKWEVASPISRGYIREVTLWNIEQHI